MFNVQTTCWAPCVDIVTLHNATVVQRLDCMGSFRSRVHEHLYLVTHLYCTGGSIALVFLLLVCKLTVATGISGLVFCQYCRMSNVPSKYQLDLFILCQSSLPGLTLTLVLKHVSTMGWMLIAKQIVFPIYIWLWCDS